MVDKHNEYFKLFGKKRGSANNDFKPPIFHISLQIYFIPLRAKRVEGSKFN